MMEVLSVYIKFFKLYQSSTPSLHDCTTDSLFRIYHRFQHGNRSFRVTIHAITNMESMVYYTQGEGTFRNDNKEGPSITSWTLHML